MGQKHLVCQGATCICKFGNTPDKLKVLTQTKSFINEKEPEEKLVATTADIGSTFEKNTFGSTELAQTLKNENETGNPIDEIQLIGLCTDICVVSNAMLLKAFMPEVSITVEASCCAGVTVKKHEAALDTLSSCQIKIL